MDIYSRYLLGCQGLLSTAVAGAKPVFTRLFKEFGLSKRIRTVTYSRNARRIDGEHVAYDDHTLMVLSRITCLYCPINGKTFARLPRLYAIQSAIFSALGISFPNPAAKAS